MKTPSEVVVGDVRIGGPDFVVIAGPCAVESEEQTIRIARAVKAAGAHILRGGAYKPRTSPRSFQGLAKEGLRILSRAGREVGLPVITEVLDQRTIEDVAATADILQVGSRNMQNFALLKELGRLRKPVCLKRGISATLEEWLLAAEYVLSGGNTRLFLCERGIRTFSDHSRNTLDLGVVSAVKELSSLPIIVDPSHATGHRRRVVPMALASAMVGAHGVMVEVHDRPEEALCDGPQALLPSDLEAMTSELAAISEPARRSRQGAFIGSEELVS